MNIFVQLYSLGIDESQTPYAEFRVFTKNEDQVYTYRFIKVYFVENTSTIAFTKVVSNKDENTNIYTKSSAIIKRPDTALIVTFEFKNNDEISPAPISGNTIYVDRYFNNQLVETLVFNDLDVSYLDLKHDDGLPEQKCPEPFIYEIPPEPISNWVLWLVY